MVVSYPVFSSCTARGRAVSFALVASALVPAAHALERITLRSGFTVECSHHEIVGGHVRLYTGKGNDFQELSAIQVASIETLPDPPKPIILPQAPPSPATRSSTFALAASVVAAAAHPELDLQELLTRAGAEHNIDVELLASVIHTESGYNVRAVSRAGARGLMQLMPSTARTYGAHDAFKPDENIAAGTAFLDEMLKRYNDNLALALAAYNAGPAAVERYHGVPPFRETRAYVTRVINEFYRRKIALGGAANSAPSSAKPVASAALKLASAPAPLPMN